MAESTKVPTYDYVIVGGGTAGCVLANRLSENPAHRVLLIEAGGTDWNPMLHIPLGSGKLLRRGLHGWKYETEPIDSAAGQRMPWPRGKVIGGSSSINAMIYARGAAAEYDMWEAQGAAGWGYAGVLPYFLRAEGHSDRADALHSGAGPHRIQRARSDNPLYDAFIAAAVQGGHRHADDLNDGLIDGIGKWDFAIHRGRRQSSAVAYLAPVKSRPNLEVQTRAHLREVLFDGMRASGIAYQRGGAVLRALATREVILAAGSIGSPHALMLSGIGDPEHLRSFGITTRLALPGVGRNLQDHACTEVRFGCPQPITLHSLIRFDRAAIAMLRAALLRSGPAAGFPAEAGGFSRSAPEVPVPDLQWYLNLGMNVSRLRVPLLWPMRAGPFERDGFTLRMSLLRPRSRGHVALASADPLAAPALHANYLSDPADVAVLRAGLRQAREVGRQPALAPFVDAELLPGSAVRSDDEIDDYIRRMVSNVHHQVGTCRMGLDAGAVVDPRLRVRGVANLRVVDASVMPVVTSGGTYAPTVMLAEKGADVILGRTR
jgi:choline dehydrogenase